MTDSCDPRISVLVSVHNGERYLRAAIDSILAQTFPRFELVVFDDCSTDSSRDLIESYDDPRIRLVVNDRNIGLTESLELGLAMARAAYVARMDADDISAPERFAAQVEYLDRHPSIALVGSSVEYIDADGVAFMRVPMPSDPAVVHELLLRVNCISHPSAMFRKDAVLQVGGYRCAAGRYAQDYDLWLRLSDFFGLTNLPDYLLQYRFHSKQVTTSKLLAQTAAAQTYRINAVKRRLARGEPVPSQYARLPTWTDSLRGTEGTVGSAYFHLSGVYRAMGDNRMSRLTCLRALRHSPLSRTILKRLLHSIFVESWLNPERARAIQWYRYRVRSMLRQREGGE